MMTVMSQAVFLVVVAGLALVIVISGTQMTIVDTTRVGHVASKQVMRYDWYITRFPDIFGADYIESDFIDTGSR
jgi:hypothetical protein